MTADQVERAQRGDHAAFEALARESAGRLLGVARRVLGDPEAAQDAVQDCLVRAWRDLRALRDPDRFDAWLFRLLRNACRDEQRRALRRVRTVEITAIEPSVVDEGVAGVARRDEIERGFSQLSVDHRMALTLHHFLGLRPAEIARVLGIPTGTATSRLHYGTKALRVALETAATSAEGGNQR